MIENSSGYKLRPIELSDLEWTKSLRNDKRTWPFLGKFSLINSYRQEQWFKATSKRSDMEYLIFEYKKTPLGLVRLTDIDRINRSVCVGGDLLPEKRGQGYVYEMYKLIFELCFNIWGMHRVWLFVLENNERAIYAYKKLGFKEEGKQRQSVFRSGKYLDYIMMSILESELKNTNNL